MKRSLFIPKHHMAIPEYDQHIRVMVMPTIDELELHWYQIRIGPIELRPQKDPHMRAVTPWELDDLDTTMQIERDEVARHVRRLMTYKRINLKSPWPSIVQIIPGQADPRKGNVPEHHQGEREQHTDPYKEEPVP
jgi:hypothetical protein